MDDFDTRGKVEIGFITRFHGFLGGVKARIHSGDLGFFLHRKEVILEDFGSLQISEVKKLNNHLVLYFQGYDSQEKAKFLLGKKLFVLRSDLNLKEGENLIEDFIGLEVLEKLHHHNEKIGYISGFFDVGEGLFEVTLLNEKKAILPISKEYWGRPNLIEKTIELKDTKDFLSFAV